MKLKTRVPHPLGDRAGLRSVPPQDARCVAQPFPPAEQPEPLGNSIPRACTARGTFSD